MKKNVMTIIMVMLTMVGGIALFAGVSWIALSMWYGSTVALASAFIGTTIGIMSIYVGFIVATVYDDMFTQKIKG